jgi:hypothetical protein
VQHLVEPEMHGDPSTPRACSPTTTSDGSCWIRCARPGFRRAEVGLWYDVFCGFVSDNHPDLTYGNMLPILIRASK